MLKFTRSKLASVYLKDEQTLAVHGILEDDIYGLELDLELTLSGLEVLSIRGKWNRMENSQCPRAIPFLQEAVGFRMDGDFVRKVQKIVGRKACRHFADLMLECCEAAKDAAMVIQMKEGAEKRSGLAVAGLFGKPEDSAKTGPSASLREKDGEPSGRAAGGMVIDLHVHSFPASPCSSISIREIVEEAAKTGLDGICLTDHNYLWDRRKVEDLRQKHGFLILSGNEITTDQGDILVFGFEEPVGGIITLKELRKKVLAAGGFMIAAHPFRGFLTFGIGYLGLTVEKAMERPVFKGVDAVEVLNGKVSEQENNFAARVAQGLSLPATGGSDAHGPGEVGLYATRFPCTVRNEGDLIEALKKGGFTPVSFKTAERTVP
jgi:predicted metal-dependent phosphoesterase TrpH